MALCEGPLMLAKHSSRSLRVTSCLRSPKSHRNLSSNSVKAPSFKRVPVQGAVKHLRRGLAHSAESVPSTDIEPSSSHSFPPPSQDVAKSFDPVARSRARKKELPPSRYQFRSPHYDRGPLHPHRPPPVSDPSSRLFVPGPFSLPRLAQTYDSTVAPDIMTMAYMHIPPGFRPPPRAPRLRKWDDSSPYHKNRPLRGPRGGDVLRLLRKPITFRNIPKVERVTVHSFVKNATQGSQWIHVAGMALQAITNVRVNTFKSKTGESSWNLRPGTTIACTAELKGEDMYHFLSKVVDVVMPRIKDWSGVKGSSGDGSGNITFGMEPEVVGIFPEIEVNYDMYPPKMIPGCHITIHTSATTDREARLLLTSIGIPFYGKFVN